MDIKNNQNKNISIFNEVAREAGLEYAKNMNVFLIEIRTYTINNMAHARLTL
jgi:hypothetical protein